MPDYNLAGLSARSFEQMIQALACDVIGPGIVVFGDGPDGGREATFTGSLAKFPSATDCWDGYLVVQAKVCQRPKGKPKEDARWAVQQLKKELDAFAERKSKRKRPEFYILATNVILSPVQDVGGKDSVAALIDQYKQKIGLKDYRVWDYDQVCRFLDICESVRHAYGAWITPGDVLAKLASTLEIDIPDFGEVMANFLQKEILDDHFSKLEQAGHSPENKIPLEEVFVDLPAFNERRTKAPDEEKSSAGLPQGFLVEMLVEGSLCLRPQDPTGVVDRNMESPIRPERGRYVLVGGPGLGKSTLAQFLCQIHRANLLINRQGLDYEVTQAVRSILDNCTSQNLPLEMAKRFPIRFELARFAKALASQAETEVTSILSYTAFLIKDRTDYEVTVENLRKWLDKYPWLVVFDGLDEVPASSNRAQVLAAIRDFLVDISTCNADILVLATTRPQGYNEEFSPQRYQHRWLSPLSIPRALHYGRTLVELTYRQNLQRKKEVLSRIDNAAKIPATARLMESPLQVTIMTRLLAQVAQPPQERYSLFQQYYEVIYRREMERGVEKLSQLLRDHEANIDAIHYRTGLLLQMESERTRHTDATISIEDFKAVVNGRLREEGYSNGSLAALTNLIATCATDRLVFLVPSQSERVGFEIRSLQEFMAAEALMDGADKDVVERLRTIAPVPFWQNVLLFAAGKCFAERQWLRDNIAQVCSQLNDDPADKLAHLTMAGSRVALSLLEDGPARRQPAYAQALARHALALLSLPPDEVHDRVADVYEPEFETVYCEELKQHLTRRDIADRIASWRVICRLLSEKGPTWVQKLAESQWPHTVSDRIELLRNLNILRSRWFLDKYSSIFFEIPMHLRFYEHERFYRMPGPRKFERLFPHNRLAVHVLALLESRPLFKGLENISLFKDKSSEVRFIFSTLDKSKKLLSPFLTLRDVHPYWKPLIEGSRLAQEPSRTALAHSLRSVAACFDKKSDWWYHYMLPWPFLACLTSAETADDLRFFADRAEQGDMGDSTDWVEAERRWKLRGITLEDLRHMTDDHWPIPRDIRSVGIPFLPPLLYSYDPTSKTGMTASKRIYVRLPGEKAKSLFASHFLYSVTRGLRNQKHFDASRYPELIELLTDIVPRIHKSFFLDEEILITLYLVLKENSGARALFNYLGNYKVRLYGGPGGPEGRKILSDLAGDLCDWVEQEPHLIGILNLLLGIANSHSITRIPKLIYDICDDVQSPAFNSALALQLIGQGLGENGFANIAERVLSNCSEDETWVLSALGVFENHQMENKAGISFLEKMLAELPPSLYRARHKVVGLLSNLLGRRVASICERTVWEKLCLPNGLPKLISE